MTDRSKEYIKMCDCPEIQEQERDGHNSYFVCGEHHLDMTKDADEYFHHLIKCKEKLIWLPRQDQLQEMVWGKLGDYCTNKISSLAWGVWDFYLRADDNYYPDSMEQLWLAFVMKELYSKIWDGEKWKDIER